MINFFEQSKNNCLTNIFVKQALKNNNVKVVEDDITVRLTDDATYITRKATVKIQDKKPDVIEFHDYMVRINNKLYWINIESVDSIVSVYGNIGIINESRREYIIKDGKKLYITTDFRGKKFLKDS